MRGMWRDFHATPHGDQSHEKVSVAGSILFMAPFCTLSEIKSSSLNAWRAEQSINKRTRSILSSPTREIGCTTACSFFAVEEKREENMNEDDQSQPDELWRLPRRIFWRPPGTLAPFF
jgi:hypothetical protein